MTSAVKCLTQLDKRQKTASKDLFAGSKDSMLYLTLLVNTLPSSVNIKPTRIQIPNGLYSEAPKKFCLIVSNQFKEKFKQELKDPSLASWKFLEYDKLRRNFKTFSEKKELFDSYDLFFCEGRVYMLIKKMLGKIFYQRNKYPFPIEFNSCLTKEGHDQNKSVLHVSKGEVAHLETFEEFSLDVAKLKSTLDDLSLKSTYFYQGNGPEYTLKIGRLSEDMDVKAVLKNIRVSTKFLLKYLMSQGLKLKFIRRISLKLAQSESFPIYSYLTPTEKSIMRQVVSNQTN